MKDRYYEIRARQKARIRMMQMPRMKAIIRSFKPDPHVLVPIVDKPTCGFDDPDEHDTFPMPVFDGG